MKEFYKPVYKVVLTCNNCPQIKQCPITYFVQVGRMKCVIEKPLLLVEIQQPAPHLMVIPEDYSNWIEKLRNFTIEHQQ